MSLNITVINEFGAWQCSDHRLTQHGRIIADDSVKHVTFTCRDGIAILAYCGVGRILDVTISDWICEILRGESRTLDETFIEIRQSAARDLANKIAPDRHMFTIAAFLGSRPWLVQIRNFRVLPGGAWGPVVRQFGTAAQPIESGTFAVFGAKVMASHRKTLSEMSKRAPSTADEYHLLLAGINADIAVSATTVSPHCTTTQISPSGHPGDGKRVHGTTDVQLGLISPGIVFGVDYTPMLRKLVAAEFGNGDLDFGSAGPECVAKRNGLRDRKK